MTNDERVLGKQICEKLDETFVNLPRETQLYVLGYMAGLAAAHLTTKSDERAS